VNLGKKHEVCIRKIMILDKTMLKFYAFEM